MPSTFLWNLNPGVFEIPKVVSEGRKERRPGGGPAWHVLHKAPLQRVSDPATVRYNVRSHLGGWTPKLPSRSGHSGPRMEWTLSQGWVSPRLARLCPSSPLLPPACPAPSCRPLLQHRQPTLAPCSQPHRCACGYDRPAGIFSVPDTVLRALHARSCPISQQHIKKGLGRPFPPGEDSEAQGESGTHPESHGVTRKSHAGNLTARQSSLLPAALPPKPDSSRGSALRVRGQQARWPCSVRFHSSDQNRTFCF